MLYRTAQNQLIAVIISRYNIRLKSSELYTYTLAEKDRGLLYAAGGLSSLAGASECWITRLPNVNIKRRQRMKPKCLLISSPIVAVALMLAANATAAPIEFVANLSGAKEVPPNASPGTGSATALFDLATHTLELHVIFSGLTSGTNAAHIHAPTAFRFAGTAGVATQVPFFDGFPLAVTSGTYDHSFDTSDASFYNPTFIPNNGVTV